MNWLLFLLPNILLVHNIVDFQENGARTPYAQRLNCLMTDYIEMLETCNHLQLINKTGCMDDKIHRIGLYFESQDVHDIHSSRKFMVALIDSFVSIMNQDQRLLSHLECPFTSHQIELHIHFVENSLCPYPTPGKIAYISFSNGIITYLTENPRKLGNFEKLREESLDLSRRILAY